MTYVNLSGYNNLITNWTAYTPTIGVTTASTLDFSWRRVGSNLEVIGQFTPSTVGSSIPTISFPNSVIANFPSEAGVKLVGDGARALASTSNTFGITTRHGRSFATITLATNASINVLDDTQLASALFTTERINVRFSVPIQGWSV